MNSKVDKQMNSDSNPSDLRPILVTGAAGDVGGIGRTVSELLLERGLRVRALVRREDERAQALRDLGAEVVIGDLLDLRSMHRAIEGCARMYFGMSVSPFYLEATINTAAVAKHHGIEAFVNMSQMTVSQMSIQDTTASPQHKLHWLAEQALQWSGLPVVNIRPTVFLEGFFLRFSASNIKKSNELALPMGLGKTSPISSFDVARTVVEILASPAAHIGRIYNLTGPQSEDLHFYAREFSAALGREIAYFDVPPAEWKEKLVNWGLPNHLIEHVTAMAELNRQGRYDRKSDDVATLTQKQAMSVQDFVRRHAAAFTAPV
jgi:uncharacterized protein YbjT (DUF2867 family)